MKIVIFAGGFGRRLWPLSRQASPKQFEPIIGTKSTVQMAVERVLGQYRPEDVFISTNSAYINILKEQLPELDESRFIGEPVRRDLAAAVGLSVAHLKARFGPDEAVAIIWGDNFTSDVDKFLDLMNRAEGLLARKTAKMVFLGETPRFANHNLGWIELGPENEGGSENPYFGFKSWVYRPEKEVCDEMFTSGRFVWNTGYFVSTIGFLADSYARFQPEMWSELSEIGSLIGRDEYQEVLDRIYPQLKVDNFDDAIAKNIDLDDAVVLHSEMGWSEPGTLYALKEALDPREGSTVLRGLVKSVENRDSLIYNYDESKLVAVVGLEGMIVVNTADALLVVHKDDVPLVKKMVEGFVGTELEKYS